MPFLDHLKFYLQLRKMLSRTSHWLLLSDMKSCKPYYHYCFRDMQTRNITCRQCVVKEWSVLKEIKPWNDETFDNWSDHSIIVFDCEGQLSSRDIIHHINPQIWARRMYIIFCFHFHNVFGQFVVVTFEKSRFPFVHTSKNKNHWMAFGQEHLL